MNAIIITISKIILAIAVLGPVVEWLLNNYPDLTIFVILLAGLGWYLFWLNSKFRKVEEKFDAKFVQMDTKFVHADHKFETRFIESDHRFEKLEIKLDEHSVAIKALQEDVTSLNNRLIAVETKVDVVKDRIDGIDKRIDGIDKRIDGIDVKLEKWRISSTNDSTASKPSCSPS
ncbi:MAG: hypothetical protein WDO15_01345 [Bacteroidota bacterium]